MGRANPHLAGAFAARARFEHQVTTPGEALAPDKSGSAAGPDGRPAAAHEHAARGGVRRAGGDQDGARPAAGGVARGRVHRGRGRAEGLLHLWEVGDGRGPSNT